MADKKLNEVTKVTDMAYVPVIMADGSIGQIAKADLASVVAAQFYSLLRDCGIFYGTLAEIQNAEPGIYGVYERSISDWGQKFGTLIVWKNQSTRYVNWLLMDLNVQNIVVGGSGGYRTLNN